jgi:small conductance mechanosensitive channel
MLTDDAQRLLDSLRLLLPLFVSNAVRVLIAIAILIAGFWVAGRVQKLARRSLDRIHHLDPMLKSFLGAIVRYFVLTIAFLAVLSQFGIQTTSLVAVLGAAGLAIGLALQGTLSQLAAGVMLLIFRPFRIGDHVLVAGIDGTVRELSLFWTELVTAENVQVIIPNAGVWGQPLRNFSTYPPAVAMAEVRFRLPGADPTEAQARIAAIAAASPALRKTPAPTVLLDRNPTDNALEIAVSFAPAGDSPAAAKSTLIAAVHKAFKEAP